MKARLIAFGCLTIVQAIALLGSFAFGDNSEWQPKLIECSKFLTLPAFDPEFSIHSDHEIHLNPTKKQVTFKGLTIKLGTQPYLLFEILLLEQGRVVNFDEIQNEALNQAGREKAELLQYDNNWLAQTAFRLRANLKSAFGEELEKRIKTHSGRGLSWTPLSLIQRSKEFQPKKITYLLDLERIFIGPEEIFLEAYQWIIFKKFFTDNRLVINNSELAQTVFVATGKELNEAHLRVHYSRLNSKFAKAIGIKEFKLFEAEGLDGSYRIQMKNIDIIK